MNKEMLSWMLIPVVLAFSAVGSVLHATDNELRLVCVGRIEPIDGEVEVTAQISGTIVALNAKEGDSVTCGTVLVELDARMEKAALDLALAKVARVKAGVGKEEIAAAEATRDAVAAELVFAISEYERGVKLRDSRAIAEDLLEQRQQRAETLRKQLTSATKQHEALKRGPLPEDIAQAEAEEAVARAAYDLRLVRAATDGTILHLYKHAGDFVSINFPATILRMANTRKLRVRVEVNEQDVYSVKVGMQGEFATFGADKRNGKLRTTTILSAFAARRLFEPDSTARMDTRTLEVLCEILDGSAMVYSGQRVTATFALKGN